MKKLIIIFLLLITGIVMYGCYSKCVVIPSEGSKEPVVIQYPK